VTELSPPAGLTDEEANRRLRAEGANELPSARRRGLAALALEAVREPMILLLLACGAVYLSIGERREAFVLLGSVLVVIAISLHQNRKTERALHALRDLSSPRARVIRGGVQRRIAGRDVARGDIVMLSEGDRVPADGILVAASVVVVDESLLTGESVPVRKEAGDAAAMGRPGGDGTPFVFSGTLVVGGRGIARVEATGPRSEMGRIGRALQTVEAPDSPLQRETRQIVRRIALAGLFLCVLVVMLFGLARHDWLAGLLAGLTLAMSLLPEEFPVVLTVFLALGAWRMSKKNVLTRRVAAIEALGAATVLAVDKTGTLTQNRMRVSRLSVEGRAATVGQPVTELPEEFHELVEFAVLASPRDPFDPMERAIRDLADAALARTEHLHEDWVLEREYPLSRELLAVSHVWRSRASGADLVIAAKGAPEAIVDLCHLPAAAAAVVERRTEALAAEGMRVLGVARARFRETADLPTGQHDFDFRFVGLLGLEDPVRPSVPAAVAECAEAGVRVVMITGDYPGTARHVAERIGMPADAEIVTGPELDAMEDAELARRIGRVRIFARAVPEQKLRLVRALSAGGEVVAMTGDGVNDAPALKAAPIGIAMGERGTDVAREAADVVLLDDDFTSIVAAVQEGRRIDDNLRRAMAYLMAVHVPIAGMSLVPVALGWPLALLPAHIVFLELIIDPACSFVFEGEPESPDLMRRPPRPPASPLLSRAQVGRALLQGGAVLAVVLAVFALALPRGGESNARALSFATLVVANIGLILAQRRRGIVGSLARRNPAFWWVAGAATLLLAAALWIPALRDLFRFSSLRANEVLLVLAAGVGSVLWLDALRALRKRHPTGAGDR
jgi:Ca2+-transporting ATPase